VSAENSDIRQVDGGVCAARGYRAAGVAAGIKESGEQDVALIVSEAPATAAAVFTRNQVVAAPVLLSRERLGGGPIHVLAVNAGNANCCTGHQGLADARRMAEVAA